MEEPKNQGVLDHISQLVAEEDRIQGQTPLNEQDRGRLAAIGVELDQYWDLLRRRRALQEFGRNPDAARLRSADVVEHYEQ